MRLSSTRTAAVQYLITGTRIDAAVIQSDGSVVRLEIGATEDLIPRIDDLRRELRNPMAVSMGNTPRLHEFCNEWGTALLPPESVLRDLDVLVLVPHGELHDLPIHLVRSGSDGKRLGQRLGVTYASSRSLFCRCAARNVARQRDDSGWQLRPSAASPSPAKRMLIGGSADVLGNAQPRFCSICQSLADSVAGKARLFGSVERPMNRNEAKVPFRLEGGEGAVILIMAHGYVDADNHRLSGLLLDRDSMGIATRCIPLHGGRYFDFRDLPLRAFPDDLTSSVDGEVLTTAELEIDAKCDSELVILLGCSAGWGRVLQGDEPASLAETYLKIGAASVVAPLWDSDIEAAGDWTHHFLDAWINHHLPKALAAKHAAVATAADHPDPARSGVMCLRGDWV